MIVLVFAAFVSIGLPDALFGTAWPSMKIEFNKSNAAVGVLNIAGSAAYIGSSAMLGTIMRKLTLAQLLSSSTALVGLGLTMYAMAPTFWAIIPAVMLLASGSGAIDAALNLYAAQHLPARYMSWLHAFYGAGALAGPFLMAIIFGMGQSWRWGYAVIAGVLWMMALIFVLTRNQWSAAPEQKHDEEEHQPTTGWRVLRMPRVQLSLLMMMGGAIIESLSSLWITSILIQRFDVSKSWAAMGLGVYWVGLTFARVVIPIFWPHAKPLRLQRISTFVALAGTIIMIPGSLPLTWVGIVLVSVGIASIFPLAMTTTAERFGPAVSTHAVGYLISASTVMFAIMPPLSGWIADTTSFGSIPVLMVIGGAILLGTQMLLERGDTPALADQI